MDSTSVFSKRFVKRRCIRLRTAVAQLIKAGMRDYADEVREDRLVTLFF